MSRQRIRSNNIGASLVEVMIAIAIAGIMLPVLAAAFVTAQSGRPNAENQLKAQAMLREAMEAVRSVREKGWTNVATNGTYHPVLSGSSWSLSSGGETIGDYSRQIVISSVSRDSSGAIVTSGGTTDPSTKSISATVSWTTPYANSVSADTFVSRWQNDTTWTQTTATDFSAGTLDNVSVTNTAGGEVQLNAGGSSISWASPSSVGSYNISGNTDANDVYVDSATNRAYVVNGASLSIINVATPSAPTLLGTYNAGSQVNGVYVSGNYAYLATASNTQEFMVINVTTPGTPTLATSINLGDTNDANCVFVSGNYAYVGKVFSTQATSYEFYVINVTTPASASVSGNLNLTANVNSITVSGNYAYLATSITTAELTVVNVTNKSAPSNAGSYNSAGTSAASDVFMGSLYLYMTKLNNTGGAEFFILDPTTPTAPTLVGTYEAGANLNGVYVIGANAFIAGASNTNEFMVLDLTTVASPTLFGSANTSVNNDIFAVSDTVYVASTANNAELNIFQGSASSGGQESSGTYESQTFDAGSAVGFNYLAFNATLLTGNTLTIQIATNNDNATWNYVGPDGTSFTSYTAGGAIPLNIANARYFRFKASLYTPSKANLPTLNDVTVNYSP